MDASRDMRSVPAQPLTTSFTQLVGCRQPIQLAVMGGGAGTPGLAVAVSEAGGLGMLSSSFPQPVSEQLAWARERTDQPLGVGFFGFDLPAKVAELELAAVDAGCDAVVAQGVEAGGHVRGTTPLIDLLDQVMPVLGVPVVAAGGIASGRAMAMALRAGASAVRVGTRFLATPESGAHPDYVAALLTAAAEQTMRTTAFGRGWPDAPHRVLRAAYDAAAALTTEVVGCARFGDKRWDVARWSAQPPTTFMTGDIAAMAMYCGMGVADVTDICPASEIVDRMAAEASMLLS
ncbi:MAG: NAD(P)H-dependent flavin oxidoreductase [Haloechinothrix sp.]